MYDFQAYINGQFINRDQKLTIISPETNQVIGTVPALNKEDLDNAFQAAKLAQPHWAALTPDLRAKYLLAFATNLKNHTKQLATILSNEIAKNLKDAEAEVVRSIEYVIETVHEYLDWIKKPIVYDLNWVQMPKNKVAFYQPKPLGVALTISPFNYPINLMITKLAPALITGNTVVHKSATQGSLSGAFIINLFDQITVDGHKLPPGVVNYVTGKGSTIGDYLIAHPQIDVASFTGSTSVGKKLAAHMVMKPYVLELGGKDAALVLDDADEQLTAQEIVKGGFSYSGQRCTAIKRVFLTDQKAKTLIPLIVQLTQKLTVGLAKDNADITAVIDQHTVQLVQKLYDDAISKGAVSLTGPLEITNNLIKPIILDQVTPEMEIAWVEPFAPILPILRYKDYDQAIKLINQSEYGLQGSIFTTSNEDKVWNLAQQLETGTVNINRSSSRGPDILPFLGIKNSGFGKQGIIAALESFTRLQGLVFNDQKTTK